jgi:sucrose-6F-phosphate phosphohydrolase
MIKILLICTDLDRTLIPNGSEPESARALGLFKELALRPWITLAYVSGRDTGLIREAIEQYMLPWPNYVISDVGTGLYQVSESKDSAADSTDITTGAWKQNKAWEAAISADWHGRSNPEVRHLLRDLPALRIQEESRQARYKVSYYIENSGARETLDKEIRQRLDRESIRANLIWSYDEMEDVRLLDILPASASKLHAIEALIDQLDFSVGNTVFCGDSGNDMEVLISCIPSVLVANSQPEVRRFAVEGAQDKGYADALYLATGGFMDMNGNYSAGMLEGIAQYHPEVRHWLQEVTS